MRHLYKLYILAAVIFVANPAYAQVTSIQHALIVTGFFINNTLIPFVIGIALLVFLVNAVRFFIIHGDSEDGREKAKRLMLYGIAAFVFTVSLWGIVNLIVSGFQTSTGVNVQTSICPDYLPTCGNDDPRGTSRINAPGRTVGSDNRNPTDSSNTGGGTTGSGGTSGTGGTTGSGGGTGPTGTVTSSLADLVFGNYQDGSSLSFANPTAQAVNGTVSIADSATCFSALNTLQLASQFENNQVGYLLYKDSNGVLHWENVTDSTSGNGIAYNANVITNITGAGATDLYLIHTHQKTTVDQAGVFTGSYPPSTADMQLMCDPIVDNMTHVTVDWNNVWVMTQPPSTCPRLSSESFQFPVIESFLNLSQVTQGSRNQEYYDLNNANNVPSIYRNELSGYANVDFDSYTDIIVGGVANNSLATANLSVQRQDVNAFCTGI